MFQNFIWCKIHKYLYRLKQSESIWYNYLNEYFYLNEQYVINSICTCICNKKFNLGFAIIIVYVYDLILLGLLKSSIKHLYLIWNRFGEGIFFLYFKLNIFQIKLYFIHIYTSKSIKEISQKYKTSPSSQ